MTGAPDQLRILDEELDIALLPGEELLVEGKPERKRLARYLALVVSLTTVCTIAGLPLLPLFLWATAVFARKHKYWITNNRVIVANGLIGYNVRSIPLERISDIAVRVSWLEKWMGIKSIIVRDMTGEAQSGATLMAVPDAPATQAHLLDYVRQVNRESAENAPQKLSANPYRDVEKLGKRDEMLAVLARIEENTRHLPKLRVATDDSHAEAIAEAAEVEAELAGQRLRRM